MTQNQMWNVKMHAICVVVMIVPLQFSKKNSKIAINAIVILKMINAFKTTLIGRCVQNSIDHCEVIRQFSFVSNFASLKKSYNAFILSLHKKIQANNFSVFRWIWQTIMFKGLMNNLFLSTLQYSAQMRTRALKEQVNGQLKNKFRCLIGHGLQIRPSRACKIITACCILYNISKDLGDKLKMKVKVN